MSDPREYVRVLWGTMFTFTWTSPETSSFGAGELESLSSGQLLLLPMASTLPMTSAIGKQHRKNKGLKGYPKTREGKKVRRETR